MTTGVKAAAIAAALGGVQFNETYQYRSKKGD